jgi:hypothetical protein
VCANLAQEDSHVRRIYLLTMALGLLAALVTGCNGDNNDEKQSNDLPQALPLLTEATDTLQNASAFEMEIDVSGYPVEIGAGGLQLPEELPLTFQYAKGMFVAPDRIQAEVQFSLGDFATTAQLIAIDRDQYLQGDLLTAGSWIQGTLIEDFTPASLLAEDTGIPHALKTITVLEMVGKEDMDGLNVYHLRGKVDASQVNALTFGLIKTKSGELDIDVYILTEERLIDQIVLREPLPDDAEAGAEPTTWTITISSYNTPATVDAPDTTS